MTTVTGFTAARMQDIEDGTVVDGSINGSGHLILEKHDGSTIDAGNVVGPTGPTGPAALQGIPGEIKMWSGATLPLEATYGLWTWANGASFDVADYPIAAAHIDPAWKTAHGLADPGAGKFRVPDLRGLVPAALDQMPVGGRANRVTRSVAIVLAGKTGEETHVVTVAEMPTHNHTATENPHNHEWSEHPHDHSLQEYYQTIDYASGGNSLSVRRQSSGGTSVVRSVSDEYSGFEGIYATDTPGHPTGVTPTITVNNNGSNGAHENMQPTVFVPYIVKLDD